MPSNVQEELARDQFVEAIGTGELRAQVRLLRPQSLREAVELAYEREVVWATERKGSAGRSRPAVRMTQLETGPFAPSETPTAWISWIKRTSWDDEDLGGWLCNGGTRGGRVRWAGPAH
ncbi:hypothetical protein EOD39_1983 [Acipenser ruthenus]|uniref:Uncharacterized protein n=1 Tax=Acipenser ruthenus TaxID=7906 RepID=A0A444U502_ACIRT|nr:hypothetical protein EOD39_1983 [Acipenser ruthenus]